MRTTPALAAWVAVLLGFGPTAAAEEAARTPQQAAVVARAAVERPDGVVETFEPELTEIQLQVLRLIGVPPSTYTTTP